METDLKCEVVLDKIIDNMIKRIIDLLLIAKFKEIYSFGIYISDDNVLYTPRIL